MNAKSLPVIVLVGATASGKTATSAVLARLLKTDYTPEIISADSRQIYRYLTIGTAKPSEELLTEIPHHCINIKNPDEQYNAGTFGSEATQIVERLLTENRIPIVVGGSGLYVQALCDGLFEHELNTDKERQILEQRLAKGGIEQLYKDLQNVDAVSAEKYRDLNPRRIIRALEYYYASGTPLSLAHKQHRIQRTFTSLFYGIDVPREELYERINRRTTTMFQDGLIEETQTVLDKGYSPTLNSLNTVGYKEILQLFEGKISKLRAIELTQQNTRHYAKRQMTWFRKDSRIQWYSGSPEFIATQIITDIHGYMNK